jgi:hypothetical protein
MLNLRLTPQRFLQTDVLGAHFSVSAGGGVSEKLTSSGLTPGLRHPPADENRLGTSQKAEFADA